MNRRGVLTMIGTSLTVTLLPLRAHADDQDVTTAIKAVFGERPLRRGRVTLKLPKLAESGNSVPISVTIKSTMSPTDRVLRACIFVNGKFKGLISAPTLGICEVGRGVDRLDGAGQR